MKEGFGRFCDNFGSDDDELKVFSLVTGEPFNADICAKLRPDEELITISSFLQFKVPPLHYVKYIRRLNQINYCDLFWGEFLLNEEDGSSLFWGAIPYKGSVVSADCIEKVLNETFGLTNKYNWELFLLSRGEIQK